MEEMLRMCVVVVMAVLVVLQLSGCRALSSTPVNQTLALQHLYDATNGPNWDYTFDGDPWNFSQPLELTDPCLGWDGITCQCNNSNKERFAILLVFQCSGHQWRDLSLPR